MEIRAALDEDIPAIVRLLKMSLGESLVPKSERYWRWKHVDNPFGVSPVLIAVADHRIVGVRAFMRWSWVSANKRIEAVRAVDTATHPEFQGKGIFSQLTKALLKDCETKGLNLVFNTPNKKSLPGYLKMGWQIAGRYPVAIRVVRPLNLAKNLLGRPGNLPEAANDNSVANYLEHPGMISLLAASRSRHKEFVTPHTVESLRWRYETVPAGRYHADGVEKDNRLQSVFFYRIKPSRLGNEFRITDLFLENENSLKGLKQQLKEKLKFHNADYVTFGALTGNNPIRGLFSLSSRAFGPVVTTREIRPGDMTDFRGFTNWNPSLGDLELF